MSKRMHSYLSGSSTPSKIPLNQHTGENTTGNLSIQSLPDEGLLLIFLSLDYSDRICGFERTCRRWRQLALARGWKKVKELNENKLAMGYEPRLSLFNRMGPHLVSLALNAGQWQYLVGLRAILGKFPLLKHLSIREWRLVDRETLDFIGRFYANTLKSLRFNRFAGNTDRVFNAMLRSFSSLEYMEMSGGCGEGPATLQFSSLVNLHLLSLTHCGWSSHPYGELLSVENAKMLGSLPFLKSLTLEDECIDQSCPVRDFSFLKHLSTLAHLRVEAVLSNVDSLLEALPHLGGSLKALELIQWPSSSGRVDGMEKRLSPVITAHLPLLEHLSIYTIDGVGEMRDNSMDGGWMQRLRSLTLHNCGESGESSDCDTDGWAWLERFKQLEYFSVEWDGDIPSDILCKLIREHKELRGMNLPRFYPDMEELKTVAEAADEKKEGEDERENGDVRRPTLHLRFEAGEETEAETAGCSRLRFYSKGIVASHILYRHKYGTLSEGMPEFAEEEYPRILPTS